MGECELILFLNFRTGRKQIEDELRYDPVPVLKVNAVARLVNDE